MCSQNQFLLPTMLERLGLAGQNGFHNLINYNISFGTLNPDFVTAHEQIHDNLIYETVDGYILRCFATIIQNSLVSSENLRIAINVINKMIIDSTILHESAATYLSVKRMSPDEEQSLLSLLPMEYVSFYRNFSDLLDPYFPTTFLQYQVAFLTSKVCLSSSLIERLGQYNFRQPFFLVENECGNHRLILAKSIISENWKELLNLLITTGKKFNADVTSEEYWNSLEIVDANRLDDCISSALLPWLKSQLGNVMPIGNSKSIGRFQHNINLFFKIEA